MRHSTTIGVDLAKNVIQVSVLSSHGKELLNRSLSRRKFAEFLAKQQTALVAFEACASAHHWARTALRHGHTPRILPAKAVLPFRQGHKTDRNDALAVAEAARRPNIKVAPLKTLEQQGLQAVQRSRDLLVQECTALSNHLRGLLMEFGIVIPQGFAALQRRLPEVLEDGDNDIPDVYRPALQCLQTRLRRLREDIQTMNQQVAELVKQQPNCRRLLDLEGVGPISAVLLYASFGTGQAFTRGREFAAYLGLTPRQLSSGGKTNIVGLSKHVGNARLRSILIQGARAYVHKLKQPKTAKDLWLLRLIERAGHGQAAVLLANKYVRSAWALLAQGGDYRPKPQLELVA